jgi:cell division protein ZapB
MGRRNLNGMTDDFLQTLEAKLEQLIEQCERLGEENRQLKEKQADWQQERGRLIEKNELARTRVEAMISRLKSLEEEAG